jgi:hypothetical protein
LTDTLPRILLEGRDLPAAICFHTEGERFVVDGSPRVEQIREVEAREARDGPGSHRRSDGPRSRRRRPGAGKVITL